MNIVFITSGKITNQAANKKSSNPWETHYFEHKIDYIDNILPTEEIIESYFNLSGDVPLDIKIDSEGILSGNILTFDEQVHVSFNKYPKETLKLDGSNWLNNGRPKSATVDFNFTVTRTIKYKDLTLPELEDDSNIFILDVSTEVTITVIKNNNIENFIFVKNYLKEGNTLKIGNDDYSYQHLNLFINRHPGPFGI